MREDSEATRRRQARRSKAARAAYQTGGVLERRQLMRMGLTRWEINGEIRAGRWEALGRQAVRVGAGEPQQRAWYRALYEVGRPAVLDGVSALIASGMRNFDEGSVHVAVPKSTRPRRCRGVVVHETRRYRPDAILEIGVPRMKPATAAVHAVLWAATDRQAATIVLMAGQQRLFSPVQFAEEVEDIKRDRRRGLLRSLRDELAGGVEALGEHDFAKLCVKRGLPPPDRQVRRPTESGRWIWDNVWDAYRTRAEIDGSQHLEPKAWIPDALKQNAGSLEGHVVLRIPNIALRLDPDPFLEQIEEALRRGGWSP